MAESLNLQDSLHSICHNGELIPFGQQDQDNKREIIALADSGPSLFTLGMMLSGDISSTNSLSSVKLQCSLYGTSYLMNKKNL